MNYRHAFHAGNHADVLKHAALSGALTLMTAKAKPMIVMDVFAGAGQTDLKLDDRPDRTGEWRDGVGRLYPAEADTPDAMAQRLVPLARANRGGALRFYPGSPLLALSLLRPEDAFIGVELHPDEHAALAERLRDDARARAVQDDGWAWIKGALPPSPRRGLLLIDPPFEAPGEEERLLEATREALRRWSVGVLMLWRPIKAEPEPFERRVGEIVGERACLACELGVGEVEAGLSRSGVVIVNPPFGLEGMLAEIGPFLARRLAQGAGAFWRLDWISERR